MLGSLHSRSQGLDEKKSEPGHGSTRTVRAPRTSITNTSVPLGSGWADQARKTPFHPPTFSRTSPAPASPRVATIIDPTQPTTEMSPTPCILLLRAPPAHPVVLEQIGGCAGGRWFGPGIPSAVVSSIRRAVTLHIDLALF